MTCLYHLSHHQPAQTPPRTYSTTAQHNVQWKSTRNERSLRCWAD